MKILRIIIMYPLMVLQSLDFWILCRNLCYNFCISSTLYNHLVYITKSKVGCKRCFNNSARTSSGKLYFLQANNSTEQNLSWKDNRSSESSNSQHFMELENLDESILQLSKLFLEDDSHTCLDIPSGLSPLDCSTKTLYELLLCRMHTTCPPFTSGLI